MISEADTAKLPRKSLSLRAKSIAKRLATENRNTADSESSGKRTVRNPTAGGNSRSSGSSSKHHTMSKYRRKVANAKERERMKEVSSAFDKLSAVVPVYKMVPTHNDKSPVTKVSTLRCAISYINALQRLIEDSNRGVLDPSLYGSHDEEEDDDRENNNSFSVNNKNNGKNGGKGKANKGQKSKTGKRSSSGKTKANSNNKHKNKRLSNKSKKKFTVRQYHASDFTPRGSRKNGGSGGKSRSSRTQTLPPMKPMSKAQLDLAIAKGLQNCKPIYAPPPPLNKPPPTSKTVLVSTAASVSGGPLQVITLPTQPLQLVQMKAGSPSSVSSFGLTSPGSGSLLTGLCGSDDRSSDISSVASPAASELLPSLEVFLQPTPSSPSPSPSSSNSSTSSASMMACSPVSSASGSLMEQVVEANILDDIQQVLMDADNFDILV